VDHSVAIMTEERGSHFDPDILDVFLTFVDEVVGLAQPVS
jgi:HD-GYP domain-containing protein (c-di-GMP phosphodiesterase class II)